MKEFIASYFSGVLTIRNRRTNEVIKEYLHNQELANEYLDIIHMNNKEFRPRKHGKLTTYNMYKL